MATPNASTRTVMDFPQPNPAMYSRAASAQGPEYAFASADEPDYGGDPDEALFQQLKSWFEEGRDRTQKWRQEAEQTYDMASGWQWDADDMQVLADDNRPTVTFNRIERNLNLISGMEIQGREEVAFMPREQGDVGKSEVLSAAVQYVTDETDAADEKSDAFRDLCTCGMGWTNTTMDYRDFEEGMPLEVRINPLEMYWDPHATRRNLKDSRWRARARVMPTTEAQRLFPGINAGLLHAPWAQIADDPSQPSEPDRQSYNYEDSPTIGRPPLLERSTIIEFQWWELEDRVIIEDLFTGERSEMDRWRAEAMMEDFPGRYQGVPVERKRYFRAFLGGMLLAKNELEHVKDFTFQCMTGKRDRRTGWYGMVRLMSDPQKWANKWLSQSMHILNTGSKNGLLYEEGSLIDPVEAEKLWGKPGAMIETAAGAIQKGAIQEKQPGAFPQELHNLLPFALQSIQDCVGVTPEQLGATDSSSANRAALLEHERRKAGTTLMAHFFDSKRLFIKQQGRLMLKFILNFMNDGRLIRIQSEGNKEYAQLMIEDPDSVRYDIIVDESPDAPNQRDKTWSTLVPMLPLVERLQPPPKIWIDILRYSPLPAQLVTAIERDMQEADQQQEGPPPDPDMLKAPAEIAKLQAEVQKLLADTQRLRTAAVLNLAKAEESGARVELDALEGVRETIAVDDAARQGRLTAVEIS